MNNQILKKITDKIGTPFFVYDGHILKNNLERLFNAAKENGLNDRLFVFVPYFTNSNPQIFKRIISEKIGILLQTGEEYYQLKKFGVNAQVAVSPSFLSDREIDFWLSKDIPVNLASLEEVKSWIKKYNKPISFRLDLTFRQNQRTGIKKRQLNELVELLKQSKVTPKSIHVYCGTGSSLRKQKMYLKKTIKVWHNYFSSVKEINLGGGFGFDYRKLETREKHFNWQEYFYYLKKLITKYRVPAGVNFLMEPGRDIFADIGKFVLSVKRIIRFPNDTEIATDGSYTYLPSATRKRRQHIYEFCDKDFNNLNNKTNFFGKLSGSATLSSDYVLPKKVEAPISLKDGDYVLIHDAGAYAATEHLEFLNKKPCPEIFVDGEKILLITERGADTDKVRYVLENPQELV